VEQETALLVVRTASVKQGTDFEKGTAVEVHPVLLAV
jgi:hypothetical protein